MKSRMLPLVLIFLFISSTAFAQLPFKLGVKAGINFSSVSYNPDLPSIISNSGHTGFLFNAIFEMGFIPMLALQVEPGYIQGGAEISGPIFADNLGQRVSGKITSKVSYLEIPILLKLKIPIPVGVSPYVYAGPDIAFLLSSNETDEPNGYPSNESDQKDFTSSTNFGLDLGAGVGIDLVPLTTLILDIRYSLGLSNILNDKGQQQNQNETIKLRGFQIAAGVMFGL